MTLFASHPTVRLRSSESEKGRWDRLFTLYTKEELHNIALSLRDIFNANRFTDGYKAVNEVYDDVLRRHNAMKKGEMTRFLAVLFASPEMRNIYVASLSPKAKSLWRAILSKFYVSRSEAETHYGKRVFTQSDEGFGYSRRNLHTVPELAMIRVTDTPYWSTGQPYLFLPPQIRAALGPLLIPTRPLIHPLADAPMSEGEARYCAEASVIGLMPAMHSLYCSGRLEKGRFKVTATTLKLLAKSLTFEEFFPDTRTKALGNLAGTLCATAFIENADFNLLRRQAVPPPSQNIVRDIVKLLLSTSADRFFPLIADTLFSRFTPTADENRHISALIRATVDALKTYTAKGLWLYVGGLHDWFSTTEELTKTLLPLNLSTIQEQTLDNTHAAVHIRPNNEMDTVGHAIALTVVGLLASLGTVELIYAPQEASKGFSPFGCIRFMRLTELGRYALGLSGSYTSAIEQAGPYFELDPDRLLIRALQDNNPFEPFLKEYASPAGGRRYKVTPETFLNGCDNATELRDKTAAFRQLVRTELPPNWDEFLTTLGARSLAVTKPAKSFYLFEVDPDDTYLHDILMNDTELRECTVCAEGYRMLVETDLIQRFTRRMKFFGYIV